MLNKFGSCNNPDCDICGPLQELGESIMKTAVEAGSTREEAEKAWELFRANLPFMYAASLKCINEGLADQVFHYSYALAKLAKETGFLDEDDDLFGEKKPTVMKVPTSSEIN